MVAASVTRRRLKLDPLRMSVYSSNGVFSSSAATPKITRAPALIFGGAVTGDVVLSIVLIVAGIILTLRARP
jgi:hypothetical protein